MNICPKCGKRLATWGNCLNCGYKKGDPVEEKSPEEIQKLTEEAKKSDNKAIMIVVCLIIAAVVVYLMTSTLQVNITGTIKVQ